ncbi:GNAT family N-acetyltransferase [Hansschlegelia beijingensis]|uniref:O-antigen/teichoic acid export membrane protein/CelD/BcsL family acetyltransferase involved in cellulose biosynthesis n=1 Tax=Hansschlegelia beijingensis TaxID=1133344 RepID=A0A7W6GFS0_9HYPH|nr:GNAT family N-acetyltransferase [Hansschlegelia beijingensis]MBB3973398.1 O-antigen/teichoic acid export membrane protein/CelD/BcsL family acetyltransferase involved in cellulose biosynthesis [Hansschlegelia beijingensis]
MRTKPDMNVEASTPYEAGGPARMSGPARLVERVRRLLSDRSDTAIAQKVAGGAFLIRVVNAGIAFVSQILLARWMGETEYGVYVYVWTWVLLLGGLTSFGLGSAPQRFIPEYSESGQQSLLRGFLIGSRVMSMVSATVIAGLGVLGIWLFGDRLESWTVVPLYLACFCVPMYVLTDVQDGIARSFNWIDVALAPAYFVRPLLILLLLGALSYENFAATATTAMAATIIATWATSIAQLTMLERRLKRRLPPGPRAYAPVTWLKISLPIFMVEGFYLLLAYTDVLVLSAFRGADEVGVYYAAVKVMSLVAFVSFSVAAAVAHRFAEYSVAGERDRLEKMVRNAARWTFWPSLAGTVIILACGWPILWLFGPGFTDGYPLLPVIAVGLLARASVGPLERLLNMLGQQNLCAAVYGAAFLLNLCLCVALVPYWGAIGAAIATSTTQVLETVVLFSLTRRRLGLGALPWRRAAPAMADGAAAAAAATVADVPASPGRASAPPPPADAPLPFRFELMTLEDLEGRRSAWDDLASRALEPNLFCEADFALAARRMAANRRVRMAVVWDDEGPGAPRMMLAVAVRPRRLLPLVRMLTNTDWAFFGALGTPLLDRERPTLALESFLEGLRGLGQTMFLFRFLPERGPTADAVRAAAALLGRPIVRVSGHERAMLRSARDAEDYLTHSLSAKKLKELRRQFRRLADEGPVDFREARAPADVAAALERFLDLEARGWKGQKGSAMRLHACQTGFLRELFARRAEKGEARVLELFVGEHLISSGLVLTSGRTAWFYKTAYDEQRSKCSPGVQLTLELTRRMLDDDGVDLVDSTAIADHPMIDHIWRERLALGDWLIAVRPGAGPLVMASARAETLRRRLRAIARDLYHRLKDRTR